jgi:hypothetical protein
MKKIISSLLLIICVAINAKAQKLVLATYMERTVAGPQLGIASHYQIRKNFNAGVFYQSKVAFNGDSQMEPHAFYGLLLQVPLVSTSRLNFIASLRSGLVNDSSIVVVPSLETEINFSRYLGVAVGVSQRMSYPAMSFRFYLKLFND